MDTGYIIAGVIVVGVLFFVMKKKSGCCGGGQHKDEANKKEGEGHNHDKGSCCGGH